MFEVIEKQWLAENIVSLVFYAPRVAESCEPGQFLIIKADEVAERIPLTIADYDREKGMVTVAVQTIGASTRKIASLEEGVSARDILGPLGHPSAFIEEGIDVVKKRRYIFVAGGLGTAPVYPQVKWLHERGVAVDVLIGARTKSLLFWKDRMQSVADHVFVTTDDGSYGRQGLVTTCLEELVKKEKHHYDQCVCIGPMVMMKFVAQLTAPNRLNLPTIVSMNPIMVDGTGMCGACRVHVGKDVRFACVDGPEFDARDIDFDEAIRRQKMVRTRTGREVLLQQEAKPNKAMPEGKVKNGKTEYFDILKRVPVAEQDSQVRAGNFEEVCFGYDARGAALEASRCLECKNPRCVEACPVAIAIPDFIREIKTNALDRAFSLLSEASSLPAVCGRVCPQEEQCEGACIRGIKGEPVAIGKLERYVADWARKNDLRPSNTVCRTKTQRVAVVGSGPAGLACAGDLAKKGYSVTIFESLHEAGGVLQYGIPEFRLPKKEVVAYEVDNVRRLGVKIETDVFVGQSITIPQLLKEEGFDAVFIATGAGLPRFMGIPGESLNGVMSANEYLTRTNLMHAFDPKYDTKMEPLSCVVTVGGGNVAMDAARTALRLGAESRLVYRRSAKELPARQEEIEHAQEEGVRFDFLCNPVEILADEDGWVSGVRCIRMELGESDASGRRRPVEIAGSEFVIACDAVIMALGTNANPRAAKGLEGLSLNAKKGIIINEETGETSIEGVFAGGDAVTGSATVILAMGAGRKAARGIDAYLRQK